MQIFPIITQMAERQTEKVQFLPFAVRVNVFVNLSIVKVASYFLQDYLPMIHL